MTGDHTPEALLKSLLVDVETLCNSVLGDAYLGPVKEQELAEALKAEAANCDVAALLARAAKLETREIAP